jgi:uncharacterized protein YebE (UPF0316 family)
MMEIFTAETWFFTWVLLPVLIFFARILDQSIGTMRLIFLSKGMKHIAPFLGFFEVIVWLLAIGQIMQHLDNWLCYVAYGAGFAMGNFIGMTLEERLSIGTSIIRVILSSESPELIAALKLHDFGLTIMDAEGAKGKVKILFSIIRRKEIPIFLNTLHIYHPTAFYTIEEVKAAKEGVFKPGSGKPLLNGLGSMLTKGKIEKGK